MESGIENNKSVEKKEENTDISTLKMSLHQVNLAWKELVERGNITDDEREVFETEIKNLESEIKKSSHEEEITAVKEIIPTQTPTPNQVRIIKELEKENFETHPNKKNKEVKTDDKFETLKKKIRRGLLYLGITAGIGSSVAVKIKDGDLSYSLNNAIENTTSILSDDLQQTAIRGLTKYGLYDPTQYEAIVDSETIPEAHTSQNKDMLKKEYQEDNTYFEVIKKVKDSHHKARKGHSDSLLMVRNQFFNDLGFTYIAGATKANMEEGQKYKNVEGVAHFMILDDYGCDVSEKMSDEYIKECSARFKKDRIGKDVSMNDYVPVFERLGDGKVRVHYTIAKNLKETDITITRLHQYKFSKIDWNANADVKSFGFSKGGIHGLALDDGTPLPNFLYTQAGKDAYSRFSGASVVFIFTDSGGNTIIRDFTGSINMIKKEGQSILKSFNIKPEDLTMGVYDAGSYTAKPASLNGILDTKQYTGYNDLHSNSGGSLIYPVKQ